MDSERLRRIEDLYHAAREHGPDSRDAFLALACAGDYELRREVSSLLAQDSCGPLDRPVLDTAAKLLARTIPAQLGPYRLLEPLGEGGMGVVYKARDTRLGRTVAIKMAHEEFGDRSEREAHAISALNHPHICTLYDIGPDYLVMELVEGELLADLLKKGPLPMRLVLQYGEQIADALAAAHAKGITHRDLKPGNIMISPTGVKLLDFGLAKFATPEDPAAGPARTLTGKQTLLGSPAYMAPEQLEGKECDARTDLFALGIVLYEMATGQRAFQAEGRAALIADILRCSPDMRRLSPPWFARLVRTCLQVDPRHRPQTALAVKSELARHRRASDSTAPRVAAIAAVAVAVAAFTLTARRTIPDVSIVPFTSFPGLEIGPSFSPDGSRIAFAWNAPGMGNFDLYVKPVGPGDAQRLTTDPRPETQPRWSPDGRWLAFLRHSAPGLADALVIPSTGGRERKLAVVDFDGDGAVEWSSDGKWLLVGRRLSPDAGIGFTAVSLESDATRTITAPPARQSDFGAAFAPDGHALAFLRERGGQPGLMLLDLAPGPQPRGEPRAIPWNIPLKLTSLCWTADSRELIVSGGSGNDATLWRLPLSGARTPERLSYLGSGTSPAVAVRGNRIAFTRRAEERNIWSLALDRRGEAVGPAVKAFDSSRSEYVPRFSPDGAKVVFESNRSGTDAIWTCHGDGSGCVALTPVGGPHVGSPSWSPDGKWIVYDVFRDSDAIDVVSAAGGPSRTLFQARKDGPGVGVPRWSRDGARIYVHCGWALQICAIPPAGGEPRPIPGADGYFADESPDGKWLYFSGGGMAGPSPLKRVPLEGGASELVLPEVAGRNWVVTETGVWFLTPNRSAESLLQFHDFATRSTRTVFRTARPVYAGLAISPDRRRLLFTQSDGEGGADILLGENFR